MDDNGRSETCISKGNLPSVSWDVATDEVRSVRQTARSVGEMACHFATESGVRFAARTVMVISTVRKSAIVTGRHASELNTCERSILLAL